MDGERVWRLFGKPVFNPNDSGISATCQFIKVCWMTETWDTVIQVYDKWTVKLRSRRLTDATWYQSTRTSGAMVWRSSYVNGTMPPRPTVTFTSASWSVDLARGVRKKQRLCAGSQLGDEVSRIADICGIGRKGCLEHKVQSIDLRMLMS